jgi:hypothetical protein
VLQNSIEGAEVFCIVNLCFVMGKSYRQEKYKGAQHLCQSNRKNLITYSNALSRKTEVGHLPSDSLDNCMLRNFSTIVPVVLIKKQEVYEI